MLVIVHGPAVFANNGVHFIEEEKRARQVSRPTNISNPLTLLSRNLRRKKTSVSVELPWNVGNSSG